MAADMEKVLNMSLDEYIASQKSSTAAGVSEGCSVSSSCSEGKFKAERRRQKCAEEAEDDDDVALVIDMEEDEQDLDESSRTELNASRSEKSFGIWRGPNLNTNYIDLDYMKDGPNNLINDPVLQRRVPTGAGQVEQKPIVDLRSRISSVSNAPNSNCSSRFMRQNVTMPGALPNQYNAQNGLTNTALICDGLSRRRWKHRQRRRTGNGNCGGNFGGGVGVGSQPSNGNWSNNQNNGGLYINHNHNNNGRVKRFNPHYTQEMLNKNISAVLERINSTNRNNNCNNLIASRTASVRDLTIECPSAGINLSPNRMSQQPQPQAPQPPQPMLQVSAQLPSQTQSQLPLNQGLKALLGVSDNSFKTEMMPMLASKFLDFLQNGAQQTIHKPIYDMQIQKEIHELQKKPLMYKCPGGEVVSSDGAGIEGCPVIPRASGVTLNYRFG